MIERLLTVIVVFMGLIVFQSAAHAQEFSLGQIEDFMILEKTPKFF